MKRTTISKKTRQQSKETSPGEQPPHPDVPVWKCPNCGQGYFGESPPDMCDYCQDLTTWERVGRRSAEG